MSTWWLSSDDVLSEGERKRRVEETHGQTSPRAVLCVMCFPSGPELLSGGGEREGGSVPFC